MEANTYIVSHSPSSESYQLWKLDLESEKLLEPVPLSEPRLGKGYKLVQIGDYILQWGPMEKKVAKIRGKEEEVEVFPYRLTRFDPANGKDALAGAPVQQGTWKKSKFWHSRADFGNPNGAKKRYDDGTDLRLVPLDNYLLNWIPTAGRGTFKLWNFDPGQKDPLPWQPNYPQGAFETIQGDHELVPIRGYVLDWVPDTGRYALWSFDPQKKMCLSRPVVQEGRWDSIDATHQLVAIGEYILDLIPGDGTYRLWGFDPTSADPLTGPRKSGRLATSFPKDTQFTGVETLLQPRQQLSSKPGTIDFMRSKIKHVVYYMIENRSFDHVCGWLYENDVPSHIIGSPGKFKGASSEYCNSDGTTNVPLSKYKGGELSDEFALQLFEADPYHDLSDVLRQLFYKDDTGYARRATPNMGGFIWNNGTNQVMETFTPAQLPVLNGLAKHFAVSDEWFCSMPGGTDVNRAFSLTGSSECTLNNFQNGNEYYFWPYGMHRPPIWKTLWSNGFRDWRIYNSTEWQDFVFTYHLFLRGHIPTVDNDKSQYVASIEQFFADAEHGNLPAFSYLEPVWIGGSGTTSYHPGADLVVGEVALNKIYDALRKGKKWEETLLVITFDEHGGAYDHVPPPYAVNPYPNDVNDGFRFDLLGVRVPAILVSPWINEKTVFRSETPVAYDLTSVLATLLKWYGIPKSRWGLGERTYHAPTFEGVFLREAARTDPVQLTPPYDKNFPKDEKKWRKDIEVSDFHRTMAARLAGHLTQGRMKDAEREALVEDMLSTADDLEDLQEKIAQLGGGDQTGG